MSMKEDKFFYKKMREDTVRDIVIVFMRNQIRILGILVELFVAGNILEFHP